MTASGERTSMPSHVPSQIIAEENTISSSTAAATSSAPVCVRQPTSRPVPMRTAIESTMPAELGEVVAEQVRRAAATAATGTGRSRPRSRSVAIEVAGPISPKARDCTRMPPMRNSR